MGAILRPRNAQEVLADCISDNKIAPNDASNGVWIREDLHRGMHTQHHYNNVNRTLSRNYYFGGGFTRAQRCGQVKEALRIIKEALEAGAFPY